MNRKIKFRVWCPSFNSFVASYMNNLYLNFETGYLNIRKDDDDEDFIITQFTGMYDKNGKEIYEGDILWRYESAGADIKTHCVIVYENDRFIPKWLGNTWFNNNLQNHANKLEVIGNIFENPELLTIN